jgi:hypothetical protein
MPGSTLATNTVNIAVNGIEVNFPDVKPIINSNGRTLVPVRFVSELLLTKVEWNEKEKSLTITRENDVIQLWVGKQNIRINNIEIEYDSAPEIVNGRVMVPLRLISELFDCTVSGNMNGNAVGINIESNRLPQKNLILKGFVIPKNTKVNLEVPREGSRFLFIATLPFNRNGVIHPSYEELRSILLQKIPHETVEEVMKYALSENIRRDVQPSQTFYYDQGKKFVNVFFSLFASQVKITVYDY